MFPHLFFSLLFFVVVLYRNLFTLNIQCCRYDLKYVQNVKPMKAIAIINGPNGVYGNVTFSQSGCGESVLIELSIIGLSPGEHGFHIHEKGDLSNGCLSTGGHYNPDKVCPSNIFRLILEYVISFIYLFLLPFLCIFFSSINGSDGSRCTKRSSSSYWRFG